MQAGAVLDARLDALTTAAPCPDGDCCSSGCAGRWPAASRAQLGWPLRVLAGQAGWASPARKPGWAGQASLAGQAAVLASLASRAGRAGLKLKKAKLKNNKWQRSGRV